MMVPLHPIAAAETGVDYQQNCSKTSRLAVAVCSDISNTTYPIKFHLSITLAIFITIGILCSTGGA